VESSCEFGIEPTGSMKCWETIEWLTSSGHSISVQLHIVSYATHDASEESTLLVLLRTSCFLHIFSVLPLIIKRPYITQNDRKYK
jgi:hypothetical protein